jgi:hypothetical protein
MALPAVGTLYYGGKINGRGPIVYTQPNGPGTPVFPPLPTVYPPQNQGYPQQVFSFEGFLSLPCGHWVNTVEVFKEYDSVAQSSAALCCCPVCSYIVEIVEPYSNWENNFYSIYPTGIGSKTYT